MPSMEKMTHSEFIADRSRCTSHWIGLFRPAGASALLALALCLSSGSIVAGTEDRSERVEDDAEEIRQSRDNEILSTQIARASALLQSKSTVNEGLRILNEAAKQGSDDARYTLGWLYFDGKVVKKDNDHAYELLKQVGGDYQIAALILIAGIREGSSRIPGDNEEAQRLFNEAAVALDVQLKGFRTRGPPDTVKDIAQRQQWLADWTVLVGLAEEYGLSVSRQSGTQ